MLIKQPQHFLLKRSQEMLRAYSQLPSTMKGDDPYKAMIARMMQYNANAFHTKDTLVTRKFYHCPITPIPYHSCQVPFKKPKPLS